MPLFQTSVLNKYLAQQDGVRMAAAYEAFKLHFHDARIQGNIRESKEEQYHPRALQAQLDRTDKEIDRPGKAG